MDQHPFRPAHHSPPNPIVPPGKFPMERGTKGMLQDPEMLRIISSHPRKRIKWALGLILGFGVTITLLLNRSNQPRIKNILINNVYNGEDICFTANLCQPSAPALSNNTYTCLGTRPRRLPPVPTEPPILPHTPLPQYCLDAHFSQGAPCSDEGPGELDVVWIWANGSDPLFQDAIEAAEETNLGPDTAKAKVGLSKGAKLYREHDELRYSLRSVLQHFGKHTSNFHLLTTDVGSNDGSRFGILPQWLRFNRTNSTDSANSTSTANSTAPPCSKQSWRDSGVNLTFMHHSQVFENLETSTFNSFSIESQLHGLSSASDPFIYMNDDFFFTRDLNPTDFYSSAYGIVLRMDPGLLVTADEWPRDTPSGEWQPLKYSNWLLSNRFGARSRPYMIHVSKTISPTLLREINSIWGEEFLDTASHRFRGQRDVYTTFLHGHYVVERWRELLLWSWVVARIGRDDDSLGEQERNAMWDEVGGNDAQDLVLINLAMRHTLEKERVREALKKAGEEEPAATEYVFSSLDGYPYALTRAPLRGWPKIAQGVDGNVNGARPDWSRMYWARCKLVRSVCFPRGLSASQMFVHVMYEHPDECGDCIIQALLNKSGRLGLEAFLPPSHRLRYAERKGRVVNEVDPFTVPRLPLSKTPGEVSFKLKHVLDETGTIRVRDWVLRAMERYRFVLGETPVTFGMLSSPLSTTRLFQKIEASPEIALLTINDDVTVKADKVDQILREFLDRRWQFPSAWEDVRYHD